MKLLIGTLLSIAVLSFGSIAYSQSDLIPSWIKNTAGYWSNDEIDDSEFFNLIQFLIDKEVINVPDTQQDDSEKVNELRIELNQIKRDSAKDVQNAYDDGYEKALSENRITSSISPNYDSCDESLKQKLLTGFASMGTLDHAVYYMPDHDSPARDYWFNSLLDYHRNINDELDKYTTDCKGTATDDERYMLGLISFLYADESAEEICNNLENINPDDEIYPECYDLFKDYYKPTE